MNINLNGKWKLYFRPQENSSFTTAEELEKQGIKSISANVPGNVELDLSAAGLLPADLFMGMNITEAEKFECYEWWYSKTFIPEFCKDSERAVLHFGGVDCLAEYYLNGTKIGESQNMFLENDFDITEKLQYGKENSLLIHIKSSTYSINEIPTDINILAYSWHDTYLSAHVRKAQHSYGWDIMPRAVSAGIWRDVSLKYEPKCGFIFTHFELISFDGNDGYAVMFYDSKMPREKVFSDVSFKIDGKCGESEFSVIAKGGKCKAGRVFFTIPNIKLWWPKNYGEPNLYQLKITAIDEFGNELFCKTQRQGFRTLKLQHSEKIEPNGGFNFIINGVKILAIGSNWVPMDVYHSRDKQRYAKALEMAKDIGCNILRCWGGNVYEDKEFFDFCDENGIMVWQDFAMACKYYPQTPEFFSLLRQEVEQIIMKFRDYSCLVLWSGDNEIDEMVAGRKKFYGNESIKPSLNKITRELVPQIAERLDPFRPFIASSPYISDQALKIGFSAYPEVHLWGPRDYFKSEYYSASKAYFVGETGYHGCPDKESVEKFITKENLWPYTEDNKEWNLHSSDQDNRPGRINIMFNQIKQLFGLEPNDFETFALASQFSQAEALKYFIERVRCQMDYMGGIIWWNLVDGWPQFSDAVVDYYYNKKKAYDFIKRSSREFIIMVSEMRPKHRAVICANSTLKKIKGKVTITDLESDKIIFSNEFSAVENGNTEIGTIPAFYSEKGMYLIVWEVDGSKYVNTYLYGNPGFDFENYKKWLNKAEKIESELNNL